jgi:hypothetical protein
MGSQSGREGQTLRRDEGLGAAILMQFKKKNQLSSFQQD